MPKLEDQYVYQLTFKAKGEVNSYLSEYFVRDFKTSKIYELGGDSQSIENSENIVSEAGLIRGLQTGELSYKRGYLVDKEHVGTRKSILKDAEYHPRIFYQTTANENIEFSGSPPFDRAALIESLRRTKLLWVEVEKILEVIAPSKDNFPAFGDSIRRAIIMICAEIETEFFAILK
jgi:hypothetical protein